MAAQDATVDSVRDREIGVEQDHLNQVYQRLEEKIHEAEFLMDTPPGAARSGRPAHSPSATPRSSGPASTSTG